VSSPSMPLSALVDVPRRFEQPWLKVGRAHRHVCFLKSEGRLAEAQLVEDRELAPAIAQVREAYPEDPELDLRLGELMREGEERVAEAVAYAEILVPMLAERLRGAAADPAPSPRPQKLTRREAPKESHDIADFIDEMLEQQLSGAR
jgi:hypothetical protein